MYLPASSLFKSPVAAGKALGILDAFHSEACTTPRVGVYRVCDRDGCQRRLPVSFPHGARFHTQTAHAQCNKCEIPYDEVVNVSRGKFVSNVYVDNLLDETFGVGSIAYAGSTEHMARAPRRRCRILSELRHTPLGQWERSDLEIGGPEEASAWRGPTMEETRAQTGGPDNDITAVKITASRMADGCNATGGMNRPAYMRRRWYIRSSSRTDMRFSRP